MSIPTPLTPSLGHLSDLPQHTHNDPDPSDPPSTPPLRPGESIPVYDAKDITGVFPQSYELVLNVAARWAGTAVEDVAQIVSLIDNKLARKGRKDRFSSTQQARNDKKAAREAWLANHPGEGAGGEKNDSGSEYNG